MKEDKEGRKWREADNAGCICGIAKKTDGCRNVSRNRHGKKNGSRSLTSWCTDHGGNERERRARRNQGFEADTDSFIYSLTQG